MKTSVLVDYEYLPDEGGYAARALVKLEGDAPPDDKHIPLNLSVVLDRSGSMAGEKLERAREAASLLVSRLRPTDVVSVVIFDHAVHTLAQPATGADQPDLTQRIATIESGGSTNLSGGWLRGRELVAAGNGTSGKGKGLNRVLLLTDGQANHGIVDHSILVGLAQNAAREGVTTTTIGFGEDYDENLLRAMADAGAGNTYYIEDPEQAPGVFEEEIEGLLSLSAQNVHARIAPTDVVRFIGVRNGYPSSAVGTGIDVELGDLYAREPKTLLLDFFVPSAPSTGSISLGAVTIIADVLLANGSIEHREIQLPVAVPFSDQVHAEPEVQRVMLLLDAAKAREEAIRLANDGDVEGAAGGMMLVSERVACSGYVVGSEAAELSQDLAALSEKIREDYTPSDAKYMAQRAYNARRNKGAYEEKLSRQRKKPPK